MTTIWYERDADPSALDGSSCRRRRLRQPGPVVGAQPARLGPRRAGVRAGRRHARRGARRRLRHQRRGRRVEGRRDLRARARRRHPQARREADGGLAGRSSPAATRSPSTASTHRATRPWWRRACSGPRCAAATRRASASSPRSACTATSRAPRWPRTLAVARAVGGLRQGAIELSPRQEAILDLATEQALAPALSHVNRAYVQVMLEHGVPLEAIVTELILSGEFERTYRLVRLEGAVAQMEHHSPTSQYGQLSRAGEFDGFDVAATMRDHHRRDRRRALRRRVGRRARRGLRPAAGAEGEALLTGDHGVRARPARQARRARART